MTASKVRYDAESDVLYLVCEEGEIARSIEVSPGITVEFGDGGNILGRDPLRLRGPHGKSHRLAPCEAGRGAVKHDLQPTSAHPP